MLGIDNKISQKAFETWMSVVT